MKHPVEEHKSPHKCLTLGFKGPEYS